MAEYWKASLKKEPGIVGGNSPDEVLLLSLCDRQDAQDHLQLFDDGGY